MNEQLSKQSGVLAQTKDAAARERAGLEATIAASKEELESVRAQRALTEQRMKEWQQLTSKLAQMISAGKLKVSVREGRMLVDLPSSVLFASGSADLAEAGKPTLAECAKPAGGPLKYTFDDTKIAAVPLDKKQTVTQAQQQHDLARAEHNQANEDYRDSGVEVELAVYQSDHAVLVSQLVAARRGSVTTNADTAALARKAATAKIAFTEARRNWLEQLASSTFYGVYAAQAKL